MSDKELTKPTQEEIDDIVGSIDYDKIVADVVANQDQIVADAVNKSKESGKDRTRKNRTAAIAGLIFGIIGIGGAIIALDTLGFFFLLAAGIIGLLFSGFMFYLSKQSKKEYEEWKATKTE